MNDLERVALLSGRLAVEIKDSQRALTALTHRSFAHEQATHGAPIADNERLEFLGDAVLDLAISQRLIECHPELSEGELSKRRAAVVNEAVLAGVGRALGLGELIAVGRGEERSGGREKTSLLADALEAVVAVTYLEAGMAGALGLVDRFFVEALAGAAAGTLGVDHKTQLQELVQGRKLGPPRYRVVAQSGPDHQRSFLVEVLVAAEVLATGEGASKKEAEQAAARAALLVVESRFSPSAG